MEKYAIDCYEHVAGQIMVVSTVCRNTFGVSRPVIFTPIMMLTLNAVWNDVLY